MTVTAMMMAIRATAMPIRRVITVMTTTAAGIVATITVATVIGIVAGMMIGATTVEAIAAIAGIGTD